MSAYIPELNALFIHVPRTAGTSMEKVLAPRTGGHETIRDYSLPPDVFKFAFVRHPLDRFVSAFFARDEVAGFEISVAGMNRYIEYISCKYPGELPYFGVYVEHFIPMHHFLLDFKDGIGVNFLGRYEKLDEHWDYLCNALRIKTLPLPHYRKFDHPHFVECYQTPKNRAYVEELYARDMELFGYS